MSQHEEVAPEPLTEEELADLIGPVSLGYFRRAPDWDKPKILAWVPQLRAMTDKDFVAQCSLSILDSAIVERFQGNHWGTHARADICHDEAKRRHQLAGHDGDCRGSDLYVKGYNRARQGQGHSTEEPTPCTCGYEAQASAGKD